MKRKCKEGARFQPKMAEERRPYCRFTKWFDRVDHAIA